MKPKLLEHLLSIIFVTIALLLALMAINAGVSSSIVKQERGLDKFGDLSFIDFSSRFQTALLKDAINIYNPGRYDANDSVFNAIVRHKQKAFSDKLQNSGTAEKLTFSRFFDLLGMYGTFLLIYLIVMALTYYGVQTLAVWRFVYKRRCRAKKARTVGQKARRIATIVLNGFGTFVLFCPAYVIAYSIRTEFNTDTVVFLVLLGVVSNGVLITYANKFYSFLVAESRKGYIDTAIVKNLDNSYLRHDSLGIPLKAIVRPIKTFKGHVFDHIFKNAQFQYLSTLKEQASFLITGLIIIEMALNIHGHLSYELLRQLLYKNYGIVIAIILGIFYTVKMTDIVTDYIMYRQSLRYENKNA
jgi:hypothetical protein